MRNLLVFVVCNLHANRLFFSNLFFYSLFPILPLPPPIKDNALNVKESQRRIMYSLFVKLSWVMGRNTVFHKRSSYEEDLEDFIPRTMPPFTGTQNVPDILTSLKN